jgi:TPP-dependent trihydroxycyclohexane-1,2-dione (THcHDO) dehydratase
MQKIEQTKRYIDQCTPIKVIEKPAKAGPITLAICQTELLQVAALGYTFRNEWIIVKDSWS